MNSVFQDGYVDTHIDNLTYLDEHFSGLHSRFVVYKKKQKSDWVCKIKKILKLLRGDQMNSPFQVKTINFAKKTSY